VKCLAAARRAGQRQGMRQRGGCCSGIQRPIGSFHSASDEPLQQAECSPCAND
jgi:hypothetical protein